MDRPPTALCFMRRLRWELDHSGRRCGFFTSAIAAVWRKYEGKHGVFRNLGKYTKVVYLKWGSNENIVYTESRSQILNEPKYVPPFSLSWLVGAHFEWSMHFVSRSKSNFSLIAPLRRLSPEQQLPLTSVRVISSYFRFVNDPVMRFRSRLNWSSSGFLKSCKFTLHSCFKNIMFLFTHIKRSIVNVKFTENYLRFKIIPLLNIYSRNIFQNNLFLSFCFITGKT